MNERQRRVLVISDLDGTLLDHHSYDATPALPAIERLRRLGIPLVLNSSKTAPEMRQVRQELRNGDPFIAENGAVLFVPGAGGADDMCATRFGKPRNHILHHLAQIGMSQDFRYLAFSTMSIEQIMASAGLDRARAHLAMSRQYTEPLLWQDSTERLDAFTRALAEHDLRAVRGGRFVFVSAPVDKATPLDALLDWYRQSEQGNAPLVIALGDGDNDVPMLERADHAVVVRSPVRERPPRPSGASVQFTELPGPGGWNLAVNALLDSLGY